MIESGDGKRDGYRGNRKNWVANESRSVKPWNQIDPLSG